MRRLLPLLLLAGLATARPIWTTKAPLKGVRADTPVTFGAFAKLAETVGPSVVAIKVRKRDGQGEGSGFIITADGYVLSNNHVVEGAVKIEVMMHDGESYPAKLVGTDPATDVAVIKVQAGERKLPVASLGNSTKLRVGEWVMAIGNPLGFEHSVTAGIVSAKERRQVNPDGRLRYPEFIQTDTSINPGNSGGPLFNMRGQVVGINTAIRRDAQGICFAVPIDMVKELVPKLIEDGQVVRSWLGVRLDKVTREHAASYGLDKATGALVTDVVNPSPAQSSGLAVGDIILGFDGVRIESWEDLYWQASIAGVGNTVPVSGVHIDGKPFQLRVKLGVQKGSKRRSGPSKRESAEDIGLTLAEVPRAMAKRMGTKGGALVKAVAKDSNAARAGIEAGDVVVKIGNQPVYQPFDLVRELRKSSTKEVKLLVRRGGGSKFITFKR